jgi:hypothetical protein
MCIPFLLLIALASYAHLLSMSLASNNGVLYSEGRAYKRMQLLTGAEQDGNVNSRVMTTLSLHRYTEVGHC